MKQKSIIEWSGVWDSQIALNVLHNPITIIMTTLGRDLSGSFIMITTNNSILINQIIKENKQIV